MLFLDELPEFGRRTLEALRQVLEQRQIVVARARITCVFPAHFQLVAAANPCPCGWWGSPQRDCRCDDGAVQRYASRISGPLLDRFDLLVDVERVRWSELDTQTGLPSSREVQVRVAAARAIQAGRIDQTVRPRSSAGTNADLADADLDGAVCATPEARALLGRAVDQLGLSARAARRVLKVGRTISDLAGDERTGAPAIAEALGYRGATGSERVVPAL